MYNLRGVTLPGFALGFILVVAMLTTLPLHSLSMEQIIWSGIGAWFGTDLLFASIVMRDDPPLPTPPHPAEPPA